MASTASFSPSPPPQTYTSTWRRKSPKLNQKFLFSSISSCSGLFFKPSLSSSSPFPLTLKPPSDPLPLHPLRDSVQDNLVEKSMNFQIPVSEFHVITPQETHPSIFIQDPSWIASLFLKGMFKRANQELKLESKEIERSNYNLLRRQIKAETGAWERMVEEYKDLERVMCEKKLAPNLPYVKALFLGWFEPLREAIARERKTQQRRRLEESMVYSEFPRKESMVSEERSQRN